MTLFLLPNRYAAHGATASPARQQRGLAGMAHAVIVSGDRVVGPRRVSLPVVLPAEPYTLVSALRASCSVIFYTVEWEGGMYLQI